MAMAVSALVLGSLVSLIFVVARATPSNASGAVSQLAAHAGLDLLATDIATATAYTLADSDSLVLTLPDRDGNGQPDSVRYDWSGSPGAPLLRQFRPSPDGTFDTASVVIPAANALTFTPDIRTTISRSQRQTITLAELPPTPPSPPATTTTAELLLDSFTSTANLNDKQIQEGEGYGQAFVPNLPANAINYRVTRVEIYLKRDKNNAHITVALRGATSGRPTSTVLAQTAVAGFTYGQKSYSWVNIPFTAAPDLDRTARASFSLIYHSNHSDWKIGVSDTGNASAGLHRTSNGSSWSLEPGSMLFRVYGTATVPAEGSRLQGLPSYDAPLLRDLSVLASLFRRSPAQGLLTGAIVSNTVGNVTTVTSTDLAGVILRYTPSYAGARPIERYFPSLNLLPAP